jgi:hypothetical protein
LLQILLANLWLWLVEEVEKEMLAAVAVLEDI